MSNKDKAQALCDFSSVFSKEPCDDFVTLPTRPLVFDTGSLVLTLIQFCLAKIKVNKSAGSNSMRGIQ